MGVDGRNPTDNPLRAEFRRTIAARFYVRFHVLIILVGVALCGFLTSKGLLLLGVRSLLVRFAVAAIVAWLAFVLLARLWAIYLRWSGGGPAEGILDVADVGARTALDLPATDLAEAGPPGFDPGGGHFGGGGATGDFSAHDPAHAAAHTGDVVHAAGHAVDPVDAAAGADALSAVESLPGLVLMLVALGLVAAGSLVLYLSPSILLELAFQTLLAAGLVRATATAERGGGLWDIARASALLFALVLLVAAAVGWNVDLACPGAARLADAIRTCPQ